VPAGDVRQAAAERRSRARKPRRPAQAADAGPDESGPDEPGQAGAGAPAGLPDVPTLLTAAVAGIGGTERRGQVTMAEAVRDAIDGGRHLAVQAGTGTGKSLAYLVPAVRHAIAGRSAVVVSTATIALQRQLIDRDLPRLAGALRPVLGREPVFAILKGRRNYLCLHRLRTGTPDDPAGTLFDTDVLPAGTAPGDGAPASSTQPGASAAGASPAGASPASTSRASPASPAGTSAGPLSAVGRQVRRLHEWAATTSTGDRDELVPGVDERAWRQVAVSAKECLGQRCPLRTECFAERARDDAAAADIVVTNHALLAINALEDHPVLPEHDVVIIDEAHDLVDRITSVASAELSASAVETAARRCARLIGDEHAGRLRDAADALRPVLADTPAGRIDVLGEALATALSLVRDAAHACAGELRATGKQSEEDAQRLALVRTALTAVDETHETSQRLARSFDEDIVTRAEVVWLDRPSTDTADAPQRPPTLRVAPLGVGGLLAERVFGRHTVVLTSATLALGGSFEPMARQWGLPAAGSDAWSGVDVGSPFDHASSGILYVARHLPPPGRDGLPAPYLDELRDLIDAAGGRTLGLFSSMRAARKAADELRDVIGYPLLCQGDDATSQLVTQFAADENTCLFGTLSLWQGVDVPGTSLQLVVIDRIPFPRPDDPLASARQRAVAARGGNGFMTVAAAGAALLLAQGTGRLLRTASDRGVVAILDPRLATARYSGFLRASLPPYWATTDPEIVRAALRRLAAAE
jgi:ATP-dependent DNA helicase DinG